MAFGVNTALTQAIYDSWLLPIDAWNYTTMCVPEASAYKALWTILLSAAVRTGARQHSWAEKDQAPYLLTDYVEIPGGHWQHFLEQGSDLYGAELARFFVAGTRYRPSGTMTYFGIRIDPVGLSVALPAPRFSPALKQGVPAPQIATPAATPPPAVARPRHPGGRPEATWWKDVISAIDARLAGDWKPTLQKQIEAEIVTEANKRGHGPGRTIVRRRASKIADSLGIPKAKKVTN